MAIDNRKDILLLLLYSPGLTSKSNEPISGRTRLIKMLFLFQKEALKHFKRGTKVDETNFYEFHAWNFGPFSSQVYDDLAFFSLRGFVTCNPKEEESLPEARAEWTHWSTKTGADEEGENDYVEEEFSLTPKAEIWTKRNLYDHLSEEQKEYLQEFKRRTCSPPLRSLLRYVYTQYPDYTDKSVIKDQILG